MVKIKDFTLTIKNREGGQLPPPRSYTPPAHEHLRSHIEQFGNNKCAVVG